MKLFYIENYSLLNCMFSSFLRLFDPVSSSIESRVQVKRKTLICLFKIVNSNSHTWVSTSERWKKFYKSLWLLKTWFRKKRLSNWIIETGRTCLLEHLIESNLNVSLDEKKNINIWIICHCKCSFFFFISSIKKRTLLLSLKHVLNIIKC